MSSSGLGSSGSSGIINSPLSTGRSSTTSTGSVIPTISISALSKPSVQPVGNEGATKHNRIHVGITGHTDQNETVTEEQLQKEWIRYARSIETDNPRLYSMMYNQLPILKDRTEVWLTLKNATQEAEIQKEKNEIFGFIKKEVRNSQLTLHVEMESDDTAPTRAFTASDKLKQMIEKNPALLTLKQKFGLDLD